RRSPSPRRRAQRRGGIARMIFDRSTQPRSPAPDGEVGTANRRRACTARAHRIGDRLRGGQPRRARRVGGDGRADGFGGHHAWLIEDELIVTACPAVMLTESSTMSVPLVPTVRPVMTSTLLLSRIRAAAAVPLASAEVSDFGNPENVRMPDAAAA